MIKEINKQTAELLDILPEEDALMVHSLIKKLIVAWDPNFTKVTAKERAILEKSDTEMKNGDYIAEKDFW